MSRTSSSPHLGLSPRYSIGKMEKNMEISVLSKVDVLGLYTGLYGDIVPTIENQKEQTMNNEMETGIIL